MLSLDGAPSFPRVVSNSNVHELSTQASVIRSKVNHLLQQENLSLGGPLIQLAFRRRTARDDKNSGSPMNASIQYKLEWMEDFLNN